MLTAHEGTSETSPESKAVPPPLEVEPTLETTQAPVEEVPLKEDHRQNVCFFNVLVGKLLVLVGSQSLEEEQSEDAGGKALSPGPTSFDKDSFPDGSTSAPSPPVADASAATVQELFGQSFV